MPLDMTKFKSTYPIGASSPLRKTTNKCEFSKKSNVDPIGMVDIFSEKREIISEYRKPNKMATLGEMRRFWDHIDLDLYNRLIEIKHLNS